MDAATSRAFGRPMGALVANCFTTDPGLRFRMVHANGISHPIHSPELATTHGRWGSATRGSTGWTL